jgi:hypothetical protein
MKNLRSLLFAEAVVFVLQPVLLPAQVDTLWTSRWTSPGSESDWAYAIALDDSGHAYVTGKTNNVGTNDDWTTIKYLADGDTAWVRNFAGAGSANERASSIAIGLSGNIFITGYTMSSSAGDYMTIKYRPDGDTAWTRRYNGTGNGYDFANWVAVDDQDNVYITGYSRALSYQNDIATVKYDSSGTQLWVAQFAGSGNYNDEGNKVIAGNDGYIYVTGTINPFGSGTRYDYVTIKYNPLNGDTIWARTYNGTADSSDIARDIEVDAIGNVYVTGSSRNIGTLSDIVTIKYDSSGIEQWVETYNNPDTSGNDGGYGIELDGSGNIYVAGQSQGQGTGTDIVLLKYDSDGSLQWASRYDGGINDYDTPSDQDGGKCMTVDTYGNIYIAGCSRGTTSWNDFITLSYNPDSTLKWAVTYNCCDSTDYGLAVAADDSGNVYTIGRSIGIATYYDMATVKYWSYVGIEETNQQSAERLLLEVYPNPARTYNKVRYALPNETWVSLSVYDISGRLVKILIDEFQTPGVHTATWEATDNKNHRVTAGVYFYVLNTNGKNLKKKVLIVK